MENIYKELEAEKYWSFPKNYKKDSKAETKNMILSNNYLGAKKIDGAYYRFIKTSTGEMRLQGRSKGVNGDFSNKIGHVPHLHSFFESLPCNTCLLGELYLPSKEGSSNTTTIMGCLEQKAIDRQTKGEPLNYYIFDIWQYDGVDFLETIAANRFNFLLQLSEKSNYRNKYVEFAKYTSGQELWELLGQILSEGGEGVVITKKDTFPEPGKRKARKTLKIKKELSQTIDCFFTGNFKSPTKEYNGKEINKWQYWIDASTNEKIQTSAENAKKNKNLTPITKPYFYGWSGALEIGVLKNGKVTPIGYISGLTDEIKAHAADYKNRVIEVTAMEILESGALRHGKMVQFRDDLALEDCTWDKIYG